MKEALYKIAHTVSFISYESLQQVKKKMNLGRKSIRAEATCGGGKWGLLKKSKEKLFSFFLEIIFK